MARKQTPLRPYFAKMADIGAALSDADIDAYTGKY